MKIKVNVEVNQTKDVITIELSDLGIEKQDWDEKTESEKHDIIQEYICDLPSQPYWMIEDFNPIN